MKKSWIISAALLAMIAGPAFAADMPVKAPAPLPPPPVLGWNGFYVGGEVGGEWSRNDWNTTCIAGGGIFPCGSALNAIIFPGAPDVTASHTFDTSGVRGGIYAGWMFQTGAWVWGLEGDYAWHDQTQTVAGVLGCSTAACTGGALVPFSLAGDSTSLKSGNDWSVRLRGGFTVLPNLLLYATGGFADQQETASVTCNGLTSPMCTQPFSATSTSSAWLGGWTVGGGLEWKAWDNILLRAEYRYNDYGHFHQSAFNNATSAIPAEFANIHVKSQMATVGIAYLFQPWSGYGLFH